MSDDRVQVEQYYSARMNEAFEAADRASQRPVHMLSASLIGGCLRQQAFRMSGTDVDDGYVVRPHRSARLGTAIHDWSVPALSGQTPGSRFEDPVIATVAGVKITGQFDLYDEDNPHGESIVDIKTVGAYSYRKVLSGNQSGSHVYQSSLYALAQVQAGNPVQWLVWIYINRDNGQDVVIARRFTADLAMAVINRVQEIRNASADPQSARREAPGPSSWLRNRSWSPCDSCPWLRRCWGTPAVGVAPQASLAAGDDIEAARYVHAYYDAKEASKRIQEDVDFNRSVLTGVKPGVYDGLELRINARKAITVNPVKEDT